MSNASKPNPGALLRRGIGYALLALGAGCASHPSQSQFPLANNGQPIKNSQGVCVQIGATPADGKPACYQLTQPDLQQHVEPLPLDEFGYLFPPLKPESKLVATLPAATTTQAPHAIAAPVPPVTPTIMVTPAPVVQAAPSVVAASVPVTTAPIATTQVPLLVMMPTAVAPHYVSKTVHFSTQLPFKLNSAHLSRKNRAALLAFVNSLEQYRGIESIRITGHTDKSGPARFNKWLSGMRAKSVQRWLLSLGVDPRMTQLRGVGSSEPRPHARHASDNRYVDIEVVVRVPAP